MFPLTNEDNVHVNDVEYFTEHEMKHEVHK
jgi:hypothetical protein